MLGTFVVRWGLRSGEGAGGGADFGGGEVKVKTWTDEGVRPYTSIVESRDPSTARVGSLRSSTCFAQDDNPEG